jgi:hypothetical protein
MKFLEMCDQVLIQQIICLNTEIMKILIVYIKV